MSFSCFNAFTVKLCIILTIFISSALRANDIQSFDDKLSHADNIRSSHPKQFLILLDELNQQRNSLSVEQQHHLNYLNFYLLMYQGDFDKSISSAQALLHSTANSLLKFRVKLGLVNISAVNQNWSEGLSYLSSILKELPKIEEKQSYHGALQMIGMFYNQLGQYNLS